MQKYRHIVQGSILTKCRLCIEKINGCWNWLRYTLMDMDMRPVMKLIERCMLIVLIKYLKENAKVYMYAITVIIHRPNNLWIGTAKECARC